MPETDPSTRQRLLELWKKCPECRVKGLTRYSPDENFAWELIRPAGTLATSRNATAIFIHEAAALAITRDAMEEYLLGPVGCDGVSHYLETIHEPRGYLVHCATVSGKNFQPTRTDALISAVEAVMDADKEKQDSAT